MARRNNINEYPGLFDNLPPEITMPPYPANDNMVRLSSGKVRKNDGPIVNPLGPVVQQPVPNKIRFISFGSGSSGNCAYIGDSKSGLLVDAGVDPKNVVDTLSRYNISMDSVKGICITHDHSDHMRFAYGLLRKYRHIKLYCTARTMNGIMRRHSISRRLKDYQVNIYKEIPFEIDNFTITAFEVMHDGTDNAGFFIEHDDRAFTIATDLGSISERADHYMRRADYLVIESNYDLNMLRFGNYPEYLKSRIRNVNGHMDNNDTAEYLAKIYTDKLKYVFLCHLSADNNTPEEALKASRTALEGIGVTIGSGEDTVSDRAAQLQLVALPRLESSRMYTLRSI